VLGFFLENLFAKRFSNFPKNFGSWAKLPQSLATPFVLTTAPIKFYLLKAKDLKFFAKLFAKSLPPEAFALPDKSQFIYHQKQLKEVEL